MELEKSLVGFYTPDLCSEIENEVCGNLINSRLAANSSRKRKAKDGAGSEGGGGGARTGGQGRPDGPRERQKTRV